MTSAVGKAPVVDPAVAASGRSGGASLACTYCGLPLLARGVRQAPPTAEPVYCCYGCRLAAHLTDARAHPGESAGILVRLGLGVVLSMLVMVLSLLLYGSDLAGQADASASEFRTHLVGLVRYLSLAFATPVLFLLGLPILTNAWREIRQRRANMDVLILIGVTATLCQSYVATLSGVGQTFYETACMVLVLVTFGRWLEATGKQRAHTAIQGLGALLPERVAIQREGRSVEVPLAEVVAGDELIIPAGQTIPVDGVVIRGTAGVDRRIVTGESAPVPAAAGDEVLAGMACIDGALVIRAERVGDQSAVGRMARLLESARQMRGRHERMADAAARMFVPIVAVAALLAAWFGWRRGGGTEAMLAALSVLLVACPCALGIATPLAAWVAQGRAAREGILVRGTAVLERLARVGTVCFDKTGTLTSPDARVERFIATAAAAREPARVSRAAGRPSGNPAVQRASASRSVAGLGTLDSEPISVGCQRGGDAASRTVIAYARGLAERSRHVYARAIVRWAADIGVEPIDFDGVREIPAMGLTGFRSGSEFLMGSEGLMSLRGFAFDPAIREELAAAKSVGRGIVCFGSDGVVQGAVLIDEAVRSEARAAVEALKQRGCDLMLLSGDHAARAERIAADLGIPAKAGLAPADKLASVASTHRGGGVAMVGDGINDAAALTAADVGIAMGCGADVTREAADVCLLGDNLLALPWLLDLSRRTVRVMRGNLLWAFGYNAVAVVLAVRGELRPIAAAAVMVVSSLVVLLNSLRLEQTGGMGSANVTQPAREACLTV